MNTINNAVSWLQRSPIRVLIGIFIFIIFLAFILFFISRETDIASPSSSTQGISPTNTEPTTTPTPTIPQQLYATDQYSITFPQGWTARPITFQGGSSFTLTQPYMPGSPLIAIESYDSPVDSEGKQAIYAGEGLKKTTIPVGKFEAIQYAGTWPQRMIDGNAIIGDTQERMVFLTLPDELYVFKLYYSGSHEIKETEAYFYQIINSFKLKP